MLSDAALAIAVGADIKWIYNASRRLGRAVDRSWDGAVWWRLTHHLAGQLGLRLADAARAADGLLASGACLSRVRLRATRDESIAIAIDIDRFLDGAAVAAAAAHYLAIPRRRGRPPRRRADAVSGPESPHAVAADSTSGSVRLADALAVTGPVTEGSSPVLALRLVSALTDAGVPLVLTGAIAEVFHGMALSAEMLDLVADCTGSSARAIADALNSAGAVPRAVPVRSGFRFDAALVRSADCLALQVAALPVNLRNTLPGVGGFGEVHETSELIAMESQSFRVLSREGLRASMASQVARGVPGISSP